MNIVIPHEVVRLLIVLGVILFFSVLFKQPSVKGALGEFLVSCFLNLGLDKDKYKILNNVVVPDGNGGTTQIDHIVVSVFGIFVIETKNMRGWIFGDRNSEKWMQQIFRTKNRFQNPFRQNYKHIVCLAEILGMPREIFTHVIVFVGGSSIRTRDQLPESLVSGGFELLAFIRGFKEKRFTEEDAGNLYESVRVLMLEKTYRNKQRHVAYVKSIVAEKEATARTPSGPVQQESGAAESSEVLKCPVCGADMIRRQVKKGKNAGGFIWGCSRFPKCRGVVKDVDSGV